MTTKESIRIELNDLMLEIDLTIHLDSESLEYDINQISIGFYDVFPSVSAIPSSILSDEDKTYLETLIDKEITKTDWISSLNHQEFCPDCELN